jgi:hypothetical protein
LYPNEGHVFLRAENFGMNAAGHDIDATLLRLVRDRTGVIAAEQPNGVPAENWLPIQREDLELNVILRIYAPDLEAYDDWTPPVAERIDP